MQEVRSEFGKKDKVVLAVGWFRWLAPGLGNAGRYGFYEEPSSVHTSTNLTGDCTVCTAGVPVRVHNFPLGEFEHSSSFLGQGHAINYWLPFFWGFSAQEFTDYLDTCEEAVILQEEKRFNEMDAKLDTIWRRVFTWTGGKSLEDFVYEAIEARIKNGPGLRVAISTAELVEEARTQLHIRTDCANSESKLEGPIDQRLARALHPNMAISTVVDELVAAYE